MESALSTHFLVHVLLLHTHSRQLRGDRPHNCCILSFPLAKKTSVSLGTSGTGLTLGFGCMLRIALFFTWENMDCRYEIYTQQFAVTEYSVHGSKNGVLCDFYKLMLQTRLKLYNKFAVTYSYYSAIQHFIPIVLE